MTKLYKPHPDKVVCLVSFKERHGIGINSYILSGIWMIDDDIQDEEEYITEFKYIKSRATVHLTACNSDFFFSRFGVNIKHKIITTFKDVQKNLFIMESLMESKKQQ
jgi:hypothetical protein